MPKAEVGSTKYLSNKMKSKGLQRLRWYCQICEKQCRDANAFKMHTQSESHTRKMLLVGEDPKKYIDEFSNQFLKDFLQLLRTSHGEKQVQINHFYQNYIANKEHVHMNATKWHSLTEFAKYLGREGICRVEENEKGIHIAWVDDSPEALRRKEAVRRKEMQDKGDEEREQMMIREQIKRARREAGEQKQDEDEADHTEGKELKRQEGEKIKLSFGIKPAAATSQPESSASPEKSSTSETLASPSKDGSTTPPSQTSTTNTTSTTTTTEKPATATATATATTAPAPAPISLKMAAKPQPKNVFAAAKKNALASGAPKNALASGAPKKALSAFGEPKKMSEAERIMKEEIERKRARESSGGREGFSNKRQRN
ncbi:domain of Kin17 curved DNA-binding protein-domain-containing protein [Daldinia caldariorum]|uniref:domain of Kin17 curved DNA-binding protein-domain-containing protein n=1 Tax=Daldinia caldariorum TaxID=326644 RepID=UPI002008C684|nr:domain of Kin17 curved DNA-binding protein-domain-containing protein [Daldinia caldariorum]KAI1469721.1 domain of Kin17 curved DNA-binding protein-domain-containing protein [Daldinia caldariorum]